MTVRIEKKGKVWTVIHSRPQARNAMDPESADALVEAFTAFDRDADAAVAVLWGEGGAFCAGWDLKYCGSLAEDPTLIHQIDYPLDDRHLRRSCALSQCSCRRHSAHHRRRGDLATHH